MTQSIPNPSGTSPVLFGVSCKSTAACTAVGSYTNRSGTQLTLGEQWDGARWTIHPTPNPPGDSQMVQAELLGVSCASVAACLAVGSDLDINEASNFSLAQRWNGMRWASVPAGGGSAAIDISCTSATACIAVGNNNDPLCGCLGGVFAERWNGTSWRDLAISDPPGMAGSLHGVSCTAETACTAVGIEAIGGFDSDVPVVERWNGTTWEIQSTPRTSGSDGDSGLSDVACTSATACLAIGFNYKSGAASKLLVERWNGATWTIAPNPKIPGGGVGTLNGLSCTSATACTAVGSDDTRTLAERWNGRSWKLQPTP